MSDRRRIIIKRRPIEQGGFNPPEHAGGVNQPIPAVQPAVDEQEYQEQAVEERRDAGKLYSEALSRYNELMQRIADIRSLDRTIQKVFHKQDFVELKMVKKKLDELNAKRSETMAAAGLVEGALLESVSELEASMASLEEELFEKLVEVEALRDAEEGGRSIDKERLARYESEANALRDEIGRIREKVNDLQAKVDEMRSLPHKINELTTSDDVSEPLLQELRARFRDEGKIVATIEKIMQDESIPRQYAIIYLWKRAFRARVS